MQQAPIKSEKKPLDNILIALAVILFLAGFYLIGSIYLASSAWYIRSSIVLASLLGSLLSLSLTSYRSRFFSLLKGARIEFKKVHWPQKNQWLITTAKVIVLVAVFAIFLSLVDWMLASFIKWIL